jgi:hypothetical protein
MALPSGGAPSGEDEEYELETARPPAPSGPPQLTFRPLLEEDERPRPAERALEAGGVGFVSAAVGASPASTPASAQRVREEKPAGVELASPTLAELYFEQGSFERAAQIYEELQGREPANERFAARLKDARERVGRRSDQSQRGTREQLVRRAIARLQELRSRFQVSAQRGAHGADA